VPQAINRQVPRHLPYENGISGHKTKLECVDQSTLGLIHDEFQKHALQQQVKPVTKISAP
jgi:hypothetical protein